MFHISTSPTGRTATSALTILAAIGASGMVAEVASAAVVEYELLDAVRTPNSTYAYLEGNWHDWSGETNWNGIGWADGVVDPPSGSDGPQRAFLNWDIDFDAGTITDARIKIRKNNTSQEYGIPGGAHVEFALITDDWSFAGGPKASPDPDGPDVGPSVLVTAPADLYFEADVTSLLQTWQANPTQYHGIRFYSTDSAGGVHGPMNPDSLQTGDLILTTAAIPEPASLGMLALGSGGILLSRRRRE